MKTTMYTEKRYLCLDCFYYMKPIKKKFNIAIGALLCTNLLAMGTSYLYHRFDTNIYLWWIGILLVATWFMWATKQIYCDSKASSHNKDNPVCLHTTRPSVSNKEDTMQGCLGILFIIGIIVSIYRCTAQNKKEISDWNDNVHVTMLKSGKKIDIPNEIFYKEHPNLKSNIYCYNDTKKVLAIYVVNYSYRPAYSNRPTYDDFSLPPYVTDIIRPKEYFYWDKESDDYIEFEEAPYSRSGLCSTTVNVVTYLDSLPNYVEIPDSIMQLIKHK